jgi:hypothetical protein
MSSAISGRLYGADDPDDPGPDGRQRPRHRPSVPPLPMRDFCRWRSIEVSNGPARSTAVEWRISEQGGGPPAPKRRMSSGKKFWHLGGVHDSGNLHLDAGPGTMQGANDV